MPLRTNGSALRRRRLLRGLTIVEFARQASYSANHISQVELGRINAGVGFLRTAARLLDCKIEDLTDGVLPSSHTPKKRPTNEASGSAA